MAGESGEVRPMTPQEIDAWLARSLDDRAVITDANSDMARIVTAAGMSGGGCQHPGVHRNGSPVAHCLRRIFQQVHQCLLQQVPISSDCGDACIQILVQADVCLSGKAFPKQAQNVRDGCVHINGFETFGHLLRR